MSDSPVTYEQQAEDEAEEDETIFTDETDTRQETGDISEIARETPRILESVPDELLGGGGQLPEERENRFQTILSILRGREDPDQDIDFGEDLDLLDPQDLQQLSDSALLAQILRRAQIRDQLLSNVGLTLKTIATTNVSILSTLQGVEDAVTGFNRITVAGNNLIDDPNSPELVVPNSDSGNVTTRKLFITASEDNQVPVYFGDDNINPEEGFILDPGQFWISEARIQNIELYMTAEQAGQEVLLLGVA